MVFIPIYNFTYFTLTPVMYLDDSIKDYNLILNNQLINSSESIAILTSPINLIINALHPKIQTLITYYLLWLILLIIMKRR